MPPLAGARFLKYRCVSAARWARGQGSLFCGRRYGRWNRGRYISRRLALIPFVIDGGDVIRIGAARLDGSVRILSGGDESDRQFEAGLPGGDARYTLYPATGDLLAAQVIVTECGLAGSDFWASPLSRFPHPARSNNATKEYRQKRRKPAGGWEKFLIRKAEL